MGDWKEFELLEKLKKLEEEEIQNVEALRVQWDGDVHFPRVEWDAAPCKPLNAEVNKNEIRRLNDERKREKDPVKRKFLSIAVFRARRKARRAQETQRCKDAIQWRALSRVNAPLQKTKTPVLERVDEEGNIEKVEEIF